MSSGIYPTLTPFTQLPIMTEAELVGTMNILLNSGLNVNQYVSLQILVEWINQNWSNVENLPPLQLTDLTTTPPVNKYVTYNVLGAAFTALNISFTSEQNGELLAHLTDYNNPHETNAALIGLNFVQNLLVTTEDDIGTNPPVETYITYDILNDALDSFNLGVLKTLNLVPNYPPYNPSVSPTGQGNTLITYADLQQALFSTQTFNNGNILTPAQIQQLQAHLTNYSNPHDVTAEQIGLDDVANLPPTYITDIQSVQLGNPASDTYITYNILQQALASLPINLTPAQIQSLVDHLTNYSNPHNVTDTQVGLSNVANLLPIAESDIDAVNNGGNPDDTYITYNMLKEANESLGFYTQTGLSINLTITSITETTMVLNAAIGSIYNYPLGNTQVSFTYYPTNNPSAAIITVPIAYSQAVNNVISIIEGPLTDSTSYSAYAVLTDALYSNIDIKSNIVTISTLAPSTATTTNTTPTVTNETPPALIAGTYFFDIVGAGSSDTTEFDSTTVDGTGGSFSGNTYVAAATGNSAISDPIGDPSADGNFTSCSSQISFSPSAFITPQSGSSATSVILTESDYNSLSSGEVLGVIVNGNIVNATIGTDCTLNYVAAYSVTTPGSNYTVPASVQETQPNIFLASDVYAGGLNDIFNYYAGPNLTGGGIGSRLTADSNIINYYTGLNGEGNITGALYTDTGSTTSNYYNGVNGTGTILGSVVVVSSDVHNVYSGENGTGNVLGSIVYGSSIINFYSGINGTGSVLGSEVEGSGSTNFYSGLNGTGSSGIYVSQFFIPFPTAVTTPSYTVNNPSVTTNYPAVWSLQFNSGVLSGTPSLLFNNTSRQPVGCISTTTYDPTGSNLIASGSTTGTIYLNGPQTFTSGQIVQAVVNGSPVNLTIGNGVTYNTVAAYTTSQTIPGSTYTVPGTTQEVQPNIFVVSNNAEYFYSEPNLTGTIVVSYINYPDVETDGVSTPTTYYYSGSNTNGSVIGTRVVTGSVDNMYLGLPENNNVIGSKIGSTFYSGLNGSGYLMGSAVSESNGTINWYNGSGVGIGSAMSGNMYSGVNETGSYGLYFNPVMAPFPYYTTTPAYTVTSPSTTTYTTVPAQYYLTLSSPLANTPTALYLTNESANYSLAPLNVTDETYDNGIITLTLSTFTGNGRDIELGLQNMIAGDTLVELKGNVTQA